MPVFHHDLYRVEVLLASKTSAKVRLGVYGCLKFTAPRAQKAKHAICLTTRYSDHSVELIEQFVNNRGYRSIGAMIAVMHATRSLQLSPAALNKLKELLPELTGLFDATGSES